MQTELKNLEAQIQGNTQSPAQVVSEQPREVRENRADEANTATFSPNDELSSPNLTEGAGIRYVWFLCCANSLTVYQFHESAFHRFQMEGTEPKAASESIQIIHNTWDFSAAELSTKYRGSLGDV